MVADSQII
jgi:hypothetical protein